MKNILTHINRIRQSNSHAHTRTYTPTYTMAETETERKIQGEREKLVMSYVKYSSVESSGKTPALKVCAKIYAPQCLHQYPSYPF